MSKIIVAIGGGGNGRIKEDGRISTYDTQKIDKEIIRLTGKEKPNYLFLAHASELKYEDEYYELMKKIYGDIYHCECRQLKSNMLHDKEKVEGLIKWADIIYEGGGSTRLLIERWQKSGFDKIIKRAWEDGKVLCGMSAGGNCWFNEATTDILRELYGNDQPLIKIKCLGFLNGHFSPHGEKDDREESLKRILKESSEVGFLVSRCASLEIVDDTFRIVTSRKEAFVKKAYWNRDKFIIKELNPTKEFENINILLDKEVK